MLNHLSSANTSMVIFVFLESTLSPSFSCIVEFHQNQQLSASFAHVSKMFLFLCLWWTILLVNNHQFVSSFKRYEKQFFLFLIFGVGVYVILAITGAANFIHIYSSSITAIPGILPIHCFMHYYIHAGKDPFDCECASPPVLVLLGMFFYTVYQSNVIVASWSHY